MGITLYGKGDGTYANFNGSVTEMIDGEERERQLQCYIGKPIDRDANIFYSRKDQLFYFDQETCTKNSLSLFLQGITIRDYDHACQVWNETRDYFYENKELPYPFNKISNNELDTFRITRPAWRLYGSERSAILDAQRLNYCVDFGTSFFINQLIRGIEYDIDVIDKLSVYSSVDADIIKSLITYRLGFGRTYSQIQIWQNQDIISFLYPNNNLASQRVSEYFKYLGTDNVRVMFLKDHLNYLKRIFNITKFNVFVDTSHVDNKCNLYISRTYYHNNNKHHGFRVLVLVHIKTGLPLYYEIIPGNIIDQNLLDRTIENMKGLGCEIKHICGDAGFGNIGTIERLMFLDGFESFTTRVNSNYNIFKDAAEKVVDNILSKKCSCFKFNNRIMWGDKSTVLFTNPNNPNNTNEVFRYTLLDEEAREAKIHALKKSDRYKTMTAEEFCEETRYYGIFLLLSARNLTFEQALQEYHDKMTVEQFFDVFKNELDALPIRVHSEEAVAAHVLIVFIASFLHILIKNRMQTFDSQYVNIAPTYNNDNIRECDPVKSEEDIIEQEVSESLATNSLSNLFYELQGQKAFVYNQDISNEDENSHTTTIVPCQPTAQCNKYYKAFGLETPLKITYENGKYELQYSSKVPNGKTKQLAFADHLCKSDLKKLAEKKHQQGQSPDDFILDEFFDKFDAKVNHLNIGRPRGSLNKSTLAKIEEENNKAFNTFDNFFEPWRSESDVESVPVSSPTPTRGPGRPRGSLNKSTLAKIEEENNKVFNTFDNFFEPWWSESNVESVPVSSPTPTRGRGRPRGSLNKSTLAKIEEENNKAFNTFDNFFAPWWSESDVESVHNSSSAPTRGPDSPKDMVNKSTIIDKQAEDNSYVFDDFFAPWWDDSVELGPNPSDTPKRGPGRPRGSRNKATLAKEAEEQSKAFYTFDDFYDWCEGEGHPDASAAKLRSKGRPLGSKNPKTVQREAFIRSLGTDPDSPEGKKVALNLRIAERKLTEEGIEPYSEQGEIRLKELLNSATDQPKRRPGRPIGSLNKSTLARQMAENGEGFDTFDHRKAEVDREATMSRDHEKTRGKYAKTTRRETFMRSMGVDPDTIRGQKIAKELRIAEKRLANDGYDPYSPDGQICLKRIIGSLCRIRS